MFEKVGLNKREAKDMVRVVLRGDPYRLGKRRNG